MLLNHFPLHAANFEFGNIQETCHANISERVCVRVCADGRFLIEINPTIKRSLFWINKD